MLPIVFSDGKAAAGHSELVTDEIGETVSIRDTLVPDSLA